MPLIKPLRDEVILSEIVKQIAYFLPDVKIYLFGSRAKGSHKPRSDFDIAVCWNKKIPAGLYFQIQDRLQKIATLKKIDL